ncbi:MAG: DUF4163 domain-containing protein [Leptospiraceae bacterium]|nr:DUF4163 domain-containing protein [Leptospiraceae bacterium]
MKPVYKCLLSLAIFFIFFPSTIFSDDIPFIKDKYVGIKSLSAGKTIRNCVIRVKYPRLINLDDTKVKDWVIRKVNYSLKKNFLDVKRYDNPYECNRNAKKSDPSFHLEINYEVKLNQGYMLSIYYFAVGYLSGAPHPENVNKGFTINLLTGEFLGYRDIFRPNSNFSSVLNKEIFEGLKELAVIGSEEEYTEVQKKEYDFYFTKDAINIINLYEIYAMQSLEIQIPIKKLQKVLNNDKVLLL